MLNPDQELQAIQKVVTLLGFPSLIFLSNVLLYFVCSSLPCIILQILHGTLYTTWRHGSIKNIGQWKNYHTISLHMATRVMSPTQYPPCITLETKLMDYVWVLVHKKNSNPLEIVLTTLIWSMEKTCLNVPLLHAYDAQIRSRSKMKTRKMRVVSSVTLVVSHMDRLGIRLVK